MREIKFRAWCQKDKQMFSWKDVGIESYNPYLLVKRYEDDESLRRNWDSDLILLQYAGLKDKNSKEIFEGDILKWEFEKQRFADELLEVRWGSVGWVLFSKLFTKFGFPDGDDCSEINTKGYTVNSEVIGNIYENPELLKGKNE